MDKSNLLESFISMLAEQRIEYCVIGGQAVNAYAEPVVSLDLDLVVAFHQLQAVERLLKERFTVEQFPHTIDVSLDGSDLRVQMQTDPRYGAFPQRASRREILGLMLPVASLEDVLTSKLWVAADPSRRASKRLKDLADIARLLEAHPHLRSRVPAETLSRLG